MRAIPDPGFAGDTGAADPALSVALAAYDASPGSVDLHRAVLEALRRSRVLVPVVAVVGETERDEAGLLRDKTSDMAAVLMTGRDGRKALLAFTGTASLLRWNPDARPVPVTARDAVLAAVQEHASALLLDVAGPVKFVVQGADLAGLGSG